MRDGVPHGRQLRALFRRLAPSALGVLAFASAGEALADDPPQDGAVLVRSAIDQPTLDFRPWRGLEARLGREMTWARWMMAGEVPTTDPDDTSTAPWLDLASFRGEQNLLRPQAGETAISALGSVVTAGLPVLTVRRGGKLRSRHVLRGYYRSRGLALAWRIEF